MNLIKSFRITCERIKTPYLRLTDGMTYREGGIFFSEGLAFCAMLEIFEVDMLIESGVAHGQSSEIWARWLHKPIIAIGNDGYGVLNETRMRLSDYKNLSIRVGDSRQLAPELLDAHRDKRIAVFIDGPKGRQALLLAKRCLGHPAVVFVGVHDTTRGHFMDGWGKTVFYTDERWFQRHYADLDRGVAEEERKSYPAGPGIGFAVSDPESMVPSWIRWSRRAKFLCRRTRTLLRQGKSLSVVKQRIKAHTVGIAESCAASKSILNLLRHLRSRSLTSLGIEYDTDKATKHGFTHIYERMFGVKRFEPVRLLEIGIKTGASLRMWEAYFPRGTVFGMDLNPKQEKDSDRIHTFVGNQEKRADLQACIEWIGEPLDIIIDDGGHTMLQQQVTLATLFPSLKPGGIYVVEDLHCAFNQPERFGVHPDNSNNTCSILEQFSQTGRLYSEYMTDSEILYIEKHVDRCKVWRIGDPKRPSITGVLHKK